MAIKTMPFDAAGYLTTAEGRAAFLAEALKTNDAAHIANALGAVARACGVAEIAKLVGLPRKELNEALSVRGNPELATVLDVLEAAGLTLTVRRKRKPAPRSTFQSATTKHRVA